MEKIIEPAEQPVVLGVVSADTKGGMAFPVSDGLLGTRKDTPHISD